MIRTYGNIELHIDYCANANYAAELNGSSIISDITVKNLGSKALADVVVVVSGSYFAPVEIALGKIAAKGKASTKAEAVKIDLSRLQTLTESVYTEFKVDVAGASFRFPLTIHAWNQWHGNNERLQEICTFVMPHHPYALKIIEKATRLMQIDIPEASFVGYDVEKPESVKVQVKAIWDALVSESLNFLTASVSLCDPGQRVMTPEMIARNRHGNCLDLTLLVCSCLERIGLAPCMVIIPGHIMPGVWLNPDNGISKAVSTKSFDICGNAGLMVIEATALCAGASIDDAAAHARHTLENNSQQTLVDVFLSRMNGIRPIPTTEAMALTLADGDIKGCTPSATNSSRRLGWERKLLDMSLRNVMLNLKPGKNIVPIWERDTAKVVDHIKAETLATVVGKQGKDNTEQLKDLYRAARTSLEENGSNSLFVSVGTLLWYDVDDPRPHIAPLLFIPVSIVRKKALTYEVRRRDDEPMVNVSLIEMLRQMFGVTMPELDPLPIDGNGFVDWSRVFEVFNAHVMEINKRQPLNRQWELPVESYVGIFSFTKFLMWRDIHTHPEIIDNHHVLRGLIDNRYDNPCAAPAADARALECDSPGQLMLPIDYDSSQLEAVAESHAGHSFVLHGPPGTGKSQTITNMIADALHSGKRVLFVAEKKAALDVVRARLDSIGLKPYCLELHSNKVDKKSFFAQVHESKLTELGSHAPGNATLSYAMAAETLKKSQTHLRDIAEAIHHTRSAHGLSLYECVNKLLECGYAKLTLSYAEVEHLEPEQVQELVAELRSLDIVAQILGYHPSESDLIGLYPRINTADNQNAVTQSLRQMPESIARVRRKAEGWLNRWFHHRTPEEILAQDPVWQQLQSLAYVDTRNAHTIDTLQASVAKWSNAIDQLRRWYNFSEKAAEISNYKLPKALDFYLNGIDGQSTADAVHSAYYSAMAYHAIDNDNTLRGFSGILHHEKIGRYKRHVADFQAARRSELLRQMARHIIDCTLTSQEEKQLALLLRRTQTNGRAVALRRVIGESADVLHRIFPCMLMSPLSVAQYLDMKSEIFDLIIFDEASQMETPDAVGTIARGKNLVVVGDPLQLPPTRFFSSQTASGEETEESEDSNSILEDCIALGMPSRYLSRHYRSRHESLIAFSNEHFYQGRLLTFPSSNDSERNVTLINPHGIYDHGKSRTNRIEAEAVVKHLTELLENSHTSPSVGIVAFSKAQSNLIEDLLNARLQRNKALQQKLDDAAEPLFIKNLENVQGDERDIIIFSIGYGPDKDGNVSLNFGPLNQSGGERRLNVAVSRARCKMTVFSSLMPHHIPAEGIAAQGVTALRHFLTFATDGTLQRQSIDARSETIIDDIARRLRAHGLQVNVKVGRSAFKIDLAVVDSHNPERYSLGIILDGRDYSLLPTVRDREVTVPTVLCSLGWTLHRIFTIDYLENPDAVIQAIISRAAQTH